MSAAVDIFEIDFIARTFFKIFEKMPLLMFAVMVVLYGSIAYLVWRSVWKMEQHH